jgi:hypothetical protein
MFIGFSRGAYTARALAGMLHKVTNSRYRLTQPVTYQPCEQVGLLSKDNHEQISFAYKLYKSSKRKDNKLAARFKKVFSCDVPIEFLGVWYAHFLPMHESISKSDCTSGIPWRASGLLAHEHFLLSAQMIPSNGSGRPCLSTRYVHVRHLTERFGPHGFNCI